MNRDGIEQCITRMKSGLAAGDQVHFTSMQQEMVSKFMAKAKKMGASSQELEAVLLCSPITQGVNIIRPAI